MRNVLNNKNNKNKIALLMHCVEPGADVLNSFHFHNQQWNAYKLPRIATILKPKYAHITWPFIITELLTLLFLLLQNAFLWIQVACNSL
jgi:hypothetical protein